MSISYTPATRHHDVLVVAIHAGYEVGTGAIARQIHARCRGQAGLYIYTSPHHVTSSVFREPVFDTVVRHYRTVISIHGMRNTEQIAHIGGRDRRSVQRLRAILGLPLQVDPPCHLAGIHPDNVVNRAASSAGVQVEISYPLLFAASPLRDWIADRIALLIRC